MAKKAMSIQEAIEVDPLIVGSMQIWLRGRTPLIFNRMANKGLHELLFPAPKKDRTAKGQMLKHDPMAEYRNSMGKNSGTGPTRLVFPAPGIKCSMATAALETKGTNKTQVGRLVWVKDYSVDVYGVPQMFMAVVRSADMNKTPDVRTRAIVSEWCIPVTIQYVTPQMTEKAILQLLSNAGIIIGVGDFRQEKGKGNFGQFEVVTKKECADIIKKGGRKQQDAAIKKPACFDADTEELWSWFQEEVKARGKDKLLVA